MRSCTSFTLFRILSLCDSMKEEMWAKSMMDTRWRIIRLRFSSCRLVWWIFVFLSSISCRSRFVWHVLYACESRKFRFGTRNLRNVGCRPWSRHFCKKSRSNSSFLRLNSNFSNFRIVCRASRPYRDVITSEIGLLVGNRIWVMNRNTNVST